MVAETENVGLLRDWRRFVIWRYEGKNKVPIDPATGRKADASDRGIWMDYETARREKLRRHSAAGIGFVLDETPFCLIDLDNCIRDGEITPFASDVLGGLRGVTEASASRTGLHSLVQAEKPGSECARKKPGQEIEVYDRARFFAIADESIVDKPIPTRQEALTALYWRIWPQMSLTSTDAAERPESVLTDAEVLEKGRACKTTGRAFVKLYDHGDWSGYPSRSEAHFRLCYWLAYWTAKDPVQIERLFWESVLSGAVERKSLKSYMQRTVQNGIKRQPRTYTPGLKSSTKERIREMAEEHVEWIAEQEWSGETDRAVYEQVTRHAGDWAYLTDDGALEFNVSQQTIADAIGKGQWTVSQSLRRLLEAGMLTRTSKGRSGKNSYYRLRANLHSQATSSPDATYSPVTGSLQTTTMKHPPVQLHSSDNGTTRMPLHSSGGSSDSEPEPLPDENPEPDGLPEDMPEIDDDGWVTVG